MISHHITTWKVFHNFKLLLCVVFIHCTSPLGLLVFSTIPNSVPKNLANINYSRGTTAFLVHKKGTKKLSQPFEVKLAPNLIGLV